MEVIIRDNPKEIAALAAETQERQNVTIRIMVNGSILYSVQLPSGKSFSKDSRSRR